MKQKALDLFYGGKVRKEFETPERIHFTVCSSEEYPVIYDKNKGWSCSCKSFSIKESECAHIQACKIYLQNNTIDVLAKKEKERTEKAFKNMKLINNKGKDVLNLAKSYFNDANYFYSKGLFIEAFELYSYVWGMLDTMARLKLLDPGKSKKDFKIDQD